MTNAIVICTKLIKFVQVLQERVKENPFE